MSASTLSPELERYRANCLEAVGAVVSEPVIDAAPFSRRGLYTNKALGKFGFLPYLMGRAGAKAQAGGLPDQFMLVVTPTHVLVYAYRARGRNRDRFEIGEELAAWKRDAISVSWKDGPPYQVDVTIAPSGENDQVLIRGGRTPWTESILRVMADPAGTG